MLRSNINVDNRAGIGHGCGMNLYEFMGSHPWLTLALLCFAVAIAQSVAKWQPVTITHNHAASPAEPDDTEEEDAEDDPTGEERITASIRVRLSAGERIAIVPADLADPIALTFIGEDWHVATEPLVPMMPNIGPASSPQTRLRFSWKGTAS